MTFQERGKVLTLGFIIQKKNSKKQRAAGERLKRVSYISFCLSAKKGGRSSELLPMQLMRKPSEMSHPRRQRQARTDHGTRRLPKLPIQIVNKVQEHIHLGQPESRNEIRISDVQRAN